MLTFVVEPALQAGLTYEPSERNVVTNRYPHGGRIVGTPTVPMPQRQYRLTVVDADNNDAQLTLALATGARPVPVDRQPTFGDATVAAQRYTVGTAVTLTPPALPAGLRYTPPTGEETHGGTPTEARAATMYTLTATDGDGDAVELSFTLKVVRIPVRVTIAPASAVEGRAVEFAVTLSRVVSRPLTLEWTAGKPGSATPGEDYHAVAAG